MGSTNPAKSKPADAVGRLVQRHANVLLGSQAARLIFNRPVADLATDEPNERAPDGCLLTPGGISHSTAAGCVRGHPVADLVAEAGRQDLPIELSEIGEFWATMTVDDLFAPPDAGTSAKLAASFLNVDADELRNSLGQLPTHEQILEWLRVVDPTIEISPYAAASVVKRRREERERREEHEREANRERTPVERVGAAMETRRRELEAKKKAEREKLLAEYGGLLHNRESLTDSDATRLAEICDRLDFDGEQVQADTLTFDAIDQLDELHGRLPELEQKADAAKQEVGRLESLIAKLKDAQKRFFLARKDASRARLAPREIKRLQERHNHLFVDEES